MEPLPPAPQGRPDAPSAQAPFSASRLLASDRALKIWYALAARWTPDPALRDDVVSRTAAIMVRVVEGREQVFESESNFVAFSGAVVCREFFGELREGKRRERALNGLASKLREGAESGGKEFSESDFEAVRDAIRWVPPRERMVLKLRLHHGLTLNEVARVTGEPRSTVNGTQDRALRMLYWVLKSRFGFDIAPDVAIQPFTIAEDASTDLTSSGADDSVDSEP